MHWLQDNSKVRYVFHYHCCFDMSTAATLRKRILLNEESEKNG
jgi:hypothetical protein